MKLTAHKWRVTGKWTLQSMCGRRVQNHHVPPQETVEEWNRLFERVKSGGVDTHRNCKKCLKIKE